MSTGQVWSLKISMMLSASVGAIRSLRRTQVIGAASAILETAMMIVLMIAVAIALWVGFLVAWRWMT